MDFQELLTNGEVLSACPISSDANLRVMTSNILASCWGEDMNADSAKKIPPYEVRSELYARVLESYLPDLIGVQESDLKWLEHFPKRLEALEKSPMFGKFYKRAPECVNEDVKPTKKSARKSAAAPKKTEVTEVNGWQDAVEYLVNHHGCDASKLTSPATITAEAEKVGVIFPNL